MLHEDGKRLAVSEPRAGAIGELWLAAGDSTWRTNLSCRAWDTASDAATRTTR